MFIKGLCSCLPSFYWPRTRRFSPRSLPCVLCCMHAHCSMESTRTSPPPAPAPITCVHPHPTPPPALRSQAVLSGDSIYTANTSLYQRTDSTASGGPRLGLSVPGRPSCSPYVDWPPPEDAAAEKQGACIVPVSEQRPQVSGLWMQTVLSFHLSCPRWLCFHNQGSPFGALQP